MKVLVLGDGLLGKEIINQTNWDYVSRSKDNFDITKIKTFNKLLNIKFNHTQTCSYDIILNCIANTDTYSNDKEKHWDVNYKGLSNLVDFCNKWNVKLIHISTDYVYSNSDPNATENTVPVHCNNWYGYTKLLGDGYVQLKSNNYLLIRCTHKYTPFPYSSAWVDQVGNFDYVDKISSLIIQLINKKCKGIYNIGTDLKTMYDLAKLTNKYVVPTLKPSYIPSNTSMDLSKLKKEI